MLWEIDRFNESETLVEHLLELLIGGQTYFTVTQFVQLGKGCFVAITDSTY
jgi:hypothetical protein